MTKCHHHHHRRRCDRPRCYYPCFTPCYPGPIICAQPCISPSPFPLPLTITISNGIIIITNGPVSYPGGVISFTGSGTLTLSLFNLNGAVPLAAVIPPLAPGGSLSGTYTATGSIVGAIGSQTFLVPPSPPPITSGSTI